MNKTTKSLFIIGLFVFSCIVYAINKEYPISNLLFDAKASEKEEVISIDEKNASIEIKTSATFSSSTGTVLFSDDFEGTASKWTFTNDTTNEWHIGTATHNGGTSSMYISNDNGVTNTYTSNSNVSIAESTVFTIPSNVVDVDIQYDWKSNGEFIGASLYDYSQVWIMPATYTPKKSTKISTADGGILIHDKMGFQTTYKTENKIINIEKITTNQVKLVFVWIDDSSGTNQPPVSIDNISVSYLDCQSAAKFRVSSVTSNAITTDWNALTTGNTNELYLGTTNTAPTATTTGISINTGNTHTFNTLTPDTTYYIWNRTNCTSGDKTNWAGPIIIKTPCLSKILPLDEGFNKNSTDLSCWSILDINQDATSPTGSNLWRTITSGVYEGDQSMYFSGSYSINHDDWLITPTYTVSAGWYKLSYYYKTSTSYTNDFEVLLSTAGPSPSSFTTVLVPLSKNNTSNYVKKDVYFQASAGSINIGWHINTFSYATIYIDKVTLEAVTCTDVQNIEIIETDKNSVDFKFEDQNNSQWEYGIVVADTAIPAIAGTSTTTKTAKATKTIDNNTLQSNTEYDLYIRAKCGNSTTYNAWVGPIRFKTECDALPLPFTEGFNTGSLTLDCWKIRDIEKDATSPTGNNLWRQYKTTLSYEGDQTMYFNGGINTDHDDWLISPTFNFVSTDIYKLTYYYKTSSSYSNDFEVLLSTNGTTPTSFTTTLVPFSKYNASNFVKKEIYIQGVSGNVNIGWHIKTTGYAIVYIDAVTVEKVMCVDPQNITLVTSTANSATVSWDDTISSSWEYFVQTSGGATPTTAGTTVTSATAQITKTTAGTNLSDNTEYDVYVRSKCLDGKMGTWFGPLKFKTLCNPLPLPFEEGFNTTSTTIGCWTSLDVNNDATSPTGSNLWRQYKTTLAYEGDQTMYFNGGYNINHDDWLISPTYNFAANTAYKLTYYYRTTTSYTNDFEVLLSNSGIATSSFTTTLVPISSYNNSSYVKKQVYIQGVSGNVNIAWHILTNSYATIYIDKVTVEKIDCVPPTNLEVTGTTTNSTDLKWTDTNSTNWEYWVQPRSGNQPTSNGQAVNNTQVTATKDHTGKNLTPGTHYEYYVRAKCSNNGFSDWSGPIAFFTSCSNYTVPYQETFNSTSDSANCWTVLDVKNDATSATGNNLWRTISTGTYEGDRAMYFSGANNITHDDWLVSPAITLTGKLYKVSYQYKTSISNSNDFDFVVSTNGTDFTNATTLISKKNIQTNTYIEEVAYIRNITGNTYFAFHVLATNNCTIYIDSFKIEEVLCTDPTNISLDNIASNSATLNFSDTLNQNWEYIVQEIGYPIPSSNGISINTTSLTFTSETASNTPLQPQTEYEVYLRSNCGNSEYGKWIGPITFKTPCATPTLPFNEDFETNSTTIDCWTIIDQNNDKTSSDDNVWSISNNGGATGRAMLFENDYWSWGASTQHNDWLITPTFIFDPNSIYMLSYKYKTSDYSWYDNKFSVKLSTTGTNTSNFTQILVPSKVYTNNAYITETVYIQGTGGNVNIAWHVQGEDDILIYIDDVSIKKIDCFAPSVNNITIDNITSNSASVSWNYTNTNSSHSYYVQPTGLAAPVAGGNTSVGNKVTINNSNTAGNPALLPDTEYDVYIKSNCGSGKSSDWVGPVKFRTKCTAFSVPFWEGFNSDSTTLNCWIKADKDGVYSPLTTNGRWKIYTTSYSYEGDRCVEFYADSANDWLISPSITTVATKYYRLKYHYRAYGSIGNIMVAYSTKGTSTTDFTNTLVPKKNLTDNIYREENVVFKGTNGTINIGWNVEATSYQDVLIDNIFVEEVVGCPEPTGLGVQNELPTSATITWDQKFTGSEWEYYVQKSGGKAPTDKTIGQGKVKTKQANADKDENGNPLQSNSEYEFYVRTVCSTTQNSIWAGPFKFMTACGVFNSPFEEGFNEGSTTLRCWSIVDNNSDSTSPTSLNIWRTTKTTKYEGSQAMEFNGSANKKHDDWLISPTLKLDGTKTYRLKYYYRTSGTLAHVNEFEVLLAKKGNTISNFTNVIKAKQVYANTTTWKEEYRFISGYDGEVNLAFHIVSDGATNLFVDQFSIEQVENCPEPLELDATNITHDAADLSWTDAFGATKFEYFVQEVGKRVPRLNDRGTPILGKSVVATKDNRTRTTLLPNTDYEYYVRTLCSDSTYSIWAGPFKFTTTCGVYQPPFEEGFNSDSKSVRCWSILDPSNNATTAGANIWKTNSTDTPYEGNGHASFVGVPSKLHDAWLITPDIELDGSLYVLKYRYKTTTNNNNEFEVLLSTTGIDHTSFTTTLVASNTYKVGEYKETIVFFNGTQATTNIAWHVTSNGTTSVYLDKVELKKVSTCPEPSHIKMDTNTSTSMQVSWQENGSAIAWEVIVVPYGKDINATPIQTVVVNNTPTATINNLGSSQMYSIYVRSICLNGTDKSDWSSGGEGHTKVGANDECSGAITVRASSNLEDCTEVFHGVTNGATKTTTALPQCWPNVPNSDPVAKEALEDQWFEFTPTHAINVIKINNVVNLTTGVNETQTFYIAVYDVACGVIATPAKWCSTLSSTSDTGISYPNMIPGQKYLIRIAYKPTGTDRHSFDLCIGSHNGKYLEVTPSQPAEPGDPDDPNFTPDPAKPYTIDKLVKNVLVNSNCKLVSNVRYQNSDGNSSAQSINTIAYFNKGETDFPFEEGIVLVTDDSKYVPGPYGNSSRGNNSNRWSGDKDLIDAVNDAGGWPSTSSTVRSTILEFDFVPIKEVLQFEYLFASNSYSSGCTNVRCEAGALFAAWLIDSETGKGINLAKINGTDTPIALNTVINNDWAKKTYTSLCPSSNPDLYWRHFENNVHNPLGADINFVGLTKAMQSDETFVIPGRKYKIKLAVLDFCTNAPHTSAAFFKAGSFDLGDLDLGADLTVDNNNAICSTDSKTIETGLGTKNVDIKWFKDDVEVIGETKPNLVITESGKYRVEAFYKDIQCPVKGEIEAEIYPAISKIVAKAEDITMCRYSIGEQELNLQTVLDKMYDGVDKTPYTTQVYKTLEDLEYSTNEIKELLAYKIAPNGQDEVIYFRIEDVRTGCAETFPLKIKLEEGEKPEKPEDVIICDSYTLPSLPANQHYYNAAGAQGQEYKAGDVLQAGRYEIFVVKDNGNGCYEETSFVVEVTAKTPIQHLDDVTLECQLFELPDLKDGSIYQLEIDGKRLEVPTGTLITRTNTKVYIVMKSENGVCYEETSFMIRYNDCPIPKGISPNGDGFNDRFDLTKHGVTSIKIFNRNGSEVYSFQGLYTDQWDGKGKNNQYLPSGTYYYVILSFDKTRTGWVELIR